MSERRGGAGTAVPACSTNSLTSVAVSATVTSFVHVALCHQQDSSGELHVLDPRHMPTSAGADDVASRRLHLHPGEGGVVPGGEGASLQAAAALPALCGRLRRSDALRAPEGSRARSRASERHSQRFEG